MAEAFFVAVVRARRTALLVGPFLTREEADPWVDVARPHGKPLYHFDTWGVVHVRVSNRSTVRGRLNDAVGYSPDDGSQRAARTTRKEDHKMSDTTTYPAPLVRAWAVENGHPEVAGKRGKLKTSLFEEFGALSKTAREKFTKAFDKAATLAAAQKAKAAEEKAASKATKAAPAPVVEETPAPAKKAPRKRAAKKTAAPAEE